MMEIENILLIAVGFLVALTITFLVYDYWSNITCADKVGEEICEDEGLVFHRTSYVFTDWEAVCTSSGRSKDYEYFTIFPEEIKGCKKQ